MNFGSLNMPSYQQPQNSFVGHPQMIPPEAAYSGQLYSNTPSSEIENLSYQAPLYNQSQDVQQTMWNSQTQQYQQQYQQPVQQCQYQYQQYQQQPEQYHHNQAPQYFQEPQFHPNHQSYHQQPQQLQYQTIHYQQQQQQQQQQKLQQFQQLHQRPQQFGQQSKKNGKKTRGRSARKSEDSNQAQLAKSRHLQQQAWWKKHAELIRQNETFHPAHAAQLKELHQMQWMKQQSYQYSGNQQFSIQQSYQNYSVPATPAPSLISASSTPIPFLTASDGVANFATCSTPVDQLFHPMPYQPVVAQQSSQTTAVFTPPNLYIPNTYAVNQTIQSNCEQSLSVVQAVAVVPPNENAVVEPILVDLTTEDLGDNVTQNNTDAVIQPILVDFSTEGSGDVITQNNIDAVAQPILVDLTAEGSGDIITQDNTDAVVEPTLVDLTAEGSGDCLNQNNSNASIEQTPGGLTTDNSDDIPAEDTVRNNTAEIGILHEFFVFSPEMSELALKAEKSVLEMEKKKKIMYKQFFPKMPTEPIQQVHKENCGGPIRLTTKSDKKGYTSYTESQVPTTPSPTSTGTLSPMVDSQAMPDVLANQLASSLSL